MTINQLLNLKHDGGIKSYIIRSYIEAASYQERILSNAQNIEANISEILDTLSDRGDRVLVVQLSNGKIAGYALLTEHINTWTGSVEGFIYALQVDESEDNRSLTQELLESIRIWGVQRNYKMLRAEVSEQSHSRTLVDRMHDLGWVTSGLIPCRVLSSQMEFVREETFAQFGDVQIRAARETDFPFVIKAMAEAIWTGLSAYERSRLNIETLQDNVRGDLEYSLRDGTSLSFVAESATGGLFAHATARIDCSHPILDIPEAELVDVYILPSFRGHGIGD